MVEEQRVRRAIVAVSPAYIGERRVHSYRHFNPIPYYAEYHGHKVYQKLSFVLEIHGVFKITPNVQFTLEKLPCRSVCNFKMLVSTKKTMKQPC